jgi:hypothetical protein
MLTSSSSSIFSSAASTTSSCGGKSDTLTLVASPAFGDFSSCRAGSHYASDSRQECAQTSPWWPLTSSWTRPWRNRESSTPLPATRSDVHTTSHELEQLLASPPRSDEENALFALSAPSTIECAFHLDDATYVRHLDYTTYRRWTHFARLLRIWEQELGIECLWIWDGREDMQVGAGAYYDEEKSDSEEEDGYEDDEDDDEENDEDGYWYYVDWYLEQGVRRREWWFARWRRRVERMDRAFGNGEKGYLVGVFGLVGVGVAFWIVLTWC